jgi:hypothetical protein
VTNPGLSAGLSGEQSSDQSGYRPVYFKVALDTPLFANEGPVVAELAVLFPGEVPT